MREIPQARQAPSPFVEGYLDELYRSGRRPTTGYPASPLPDAGDRTMKVETCYVGARRRDRPAA